MIRRLTFFLLCFGTLSCGSARIESQTGVADPAAGASKRTSPDGSAADDDGDFNLREGDAKSARGASSSTLRPTATEAVLKLTVQNDKKEPISGVVVKAESPDGVALYTEETDETGYTETMIPVGRSYRITYLSLFQDTIEKSVTIPNETHVTMRLTLTYTPMEPPPSPADIDKDKGPALVLEGVVFDTAKSTLRSESYPHLEGVIEYMTFKKSAIIELSGHTDSRGDAKRNLKLSEDRANAVRDYLIAKGIEGTRIIAVGYGQERPIATNDTEEGRQKNRRTEARDLTP